MTYNVFGGKLNLAQSIKRHLKLKANAVVSECTLCYRAVAY